MTQPSLFLFVVLALAVSCSDSSGNSSNNAVQDVGTLADSGASDAAGLSDFSTADSGSDVGSADAGSSLGLIRIDDLKFNGAFRLKPGEYGESSIDYAVGTLGFNPENQSLFIAGHAQHNAIAEYPIIAPGMQQTVEDLPVTADPLQPFVRVLGTGGNPEGIDKVTGMLWLDGALLVNAERWYDAAGQNADTTLVIRDADDLAGERDGYFELSCGARCAGYMGPIPQSLQGELGASFYTGWSSVYSIISRYSVGPSLWTFDPTAMIEGSASGSPGVAATGLMSFPHPDGIISERALEWGQQGTSGPFPAADPVWNPISRGRYGFFVEGSRTFAVIGSTGGLESGIGYKAVQSDGNQCGGPCAYEPDDYTNYYWLFDIDEILNASSLDAPRPYAYGAWEVPFDNDGRNAIIGATLDAQNGILYMAIENAAQVGDYDRPPLIVTYRLP